MPEHIVCQNQVELIYENIDKALFNGIEIWLDFGSCQDPTEYCGIAHLLEHLIVFSELKEIDLYALKKSYGKTSKERIRIYTSVSVKKTEAVFQRILNNIVNLNPPEYIFEFQKSKVMNEVLRINRSALLQYLSAAEEKTLYGTGYEKPVEGTEYGVTNLELDYVKKYLSEKLLSCGIIVSIAGNANVSNLKKIIENNIRRAAVLIKLNDVALDNRILNENRIFLETASFNGKLLILGSYPNGIDQTLNMVCSRIFEEYLKYSFMDLPILVKNVDYKRYHLLTIYIPGFNRKLKYIEDKIRHFGKEINNCVFELIKNYVYEEYQSMLEDCAKLSFYNAEQCFFNHNISLTDLLYDIEKISMDDFHRYIQCVLGKKNINSVVPRTITER